MSQLIVTTPTRPPAFRDQSDAEQVDRRAERRRARLWTLIEALGYAGAYVDPSGILAVQRLRWAQAKEAERRGRQ
jgi:hypothetical protein